jgi:hypothetical protein
VATFTSHKLKEEMEGKATATLAFVAVTAAAAAAAATGCCCCIHVLALRAAWVL